MDKIGRNDFSAEGWPLGRAHGRAGQWSIGLFIPSGRLAEVLRATR